MENCPSIRSQKAEIRSFVFFKNTTNRTVDIYWVNYSGKFIQYSSLKPEQQCSVDTYVTHPWIFKDKFTGERMHVNHDDFYYAEPWYSNIDSNGKPFRLLVKIHFPLRSLRENCIWKVLSLLDDKQKLYELQLPTVLVEELDILTK